MLRSGAARLRFHWSPAGSVVVRLENKQAAPASNAPLKRAHAAARPKDGRRSEEGLLLLKRQKEKYNFNSRWLCRREEHKPAKAPSSAGGAGRLSCTGKPATKTGRFPLHRISRSPWCSRAMWQKTEENESSVGFLDLQGVGEDQIFDDFLCVRC